MPKYKDEPPAVRVYTVCDESKYLIVRNVPSLGCGDELLRLFSAYGQVEDCKPMDAEDCEAYTDVYWIKFHRINNARFAKRKIDESVFLGNGLQVSYAPQYETLFDTKEKLEARSNEVLARLNSRTTKGPSASTSEPSALPAPLLKDTFPHTSSLSQRQSSESQTATSECTSTTSTVSSYEEYFPSVSMNRTVQLVREKLNKIKSSAEQRETGSSKRVRVDNRRRI